MSQWQTALGLVLTVAACAQSPGESALNFNTLGNSASEAGDYAGAARQYREAIAIWRSLGPVYEAHLAGSLLNLGSVLCGAGLRADGAAAFEEALALHRRTLGVRHKRTVANMTMLASDYLMLGDLQKAEAILAEALPIARAEFPDDVQTARCLEIQSGVLNRHGNLRESVGTAEEGLAIAIRSAGEDSLEAALAYATAAEAFRSMGRNDRALPLYRKAHALYEKFLGPDHPRVASLWSQEALIAMEEGKLTTAEQSMLQAVAILKKSCPDCVVELAVAQNNLGLLRLKQKRYREAGESLSEAVALRKNFSPGPTVELTSTMESLAYARKMEKQNPRTAGTLGLR